MRKALFPVGVAPFFTLDRVEDATWSAFRGQGRSVRCLSLAESFQTKPLLLQNRFPLPPLRLLLYEAHRAIEFGMFSRLNAEWFFRLHMNIIK